MGETELRAKAGPAEGTGAPDGGRGYNPVDFIALIYFGITGVLLFFSIGTLPKVGWFILLHAVILLAVGALRWAPRSGAKGVVRFLRDWYLVLPIAWIFLEVSVLNRIFHSGFFDHKIRAIESRLFGGFPSTYLKERLPSILLSEYLHFSYFSYYWLFPVFGIYLYAKRKFVEFRAAVAATATTMFGCYLFFIAFPVTGPYYFDKPPPPETMGWIFTALARAAVDSGSAVGTAFPSSHMAVSTSILLSSFRFARPLFYVYLPLVLGIGFGAVYAGFHYAIDMTVGAVYGSLLWMLGIHLDGKFARRLGLESAG